MKEYYEDKIEDREKYNELLKIWKDVEAPKGFFEGHNGWEHISVKSDEREEKLKDIIRNNKGVVIERVEGGLWSRPQFYYAFKIYDEDDIKDALDYHTCDWFKSKEVHFYERNGKINALLQVVDWY